MSALKPKPPRTPASAGARSAGSATDGNDLILGAHRKNLLTKKASSVADSVSTKSTLQAEVDSLKRQLKDSEKRLSTPVKGNRRPRDSVQAQSIGLQGERYNDAPYEPVQPRIMWEPFDSDPEVREEMERLHDSERRIQRRHETWAHEWSRQDRDQHAKIEAPNPAVFSARDDDAVMVLAARAEEFAATGLSPKRHDTRATSQQAGERHARTYSPSGASRSNSRVGSRANSRANRRTSSLHPASMQVLQSFGLKDAVDIILPDPEEVVDDRKGDILGDQFILKRDLFDAAFARRDNGNVMSGAPGFRMIPRFNIGAVSQAHMSGVRTILNEITKQWDGPVVWVNLREEPVVYINNRSYIVRSAEDPCVPLATPGIKAARLEELETKLRDEVLREGQRFGGNVIVHKEAGDRSMEAQWEAVEEGSVHTLRSVFDGIKMGGYDVRYVRLPVTPHEGISRPLLDEMFKVCEQYPTDPIITNCQTGRGRSTVAMIICTIVRYYQHSVGGTATTHESMLERAETAAGFRKLGQLVALLDNGRVHEQRVSMMCELTGKSSNLTERIVSALRTDITPAGVGLLSRYCQLVAFSAYCEARLEKKTTTLSFSQWVADNKDVDSLLCSFDAPDVVEEIRSMAAPDGTSPEKAEEPAAFPEAANSTRRGDILLPGTCLAAIAPDCASREAVSGVTALRQVSMAVPIFTCGRSSKEGLEALIASACDIHQAAPRVDLVDVRAEPHVYVNGSAYFVAPKASIFKTRAHQMNITGAAIEDMERRLKADVLAAADANDGTIDLVLAEPSTKEIENRCVKVSSVLTPREHCEQLTSPKSLSYRRIPVVVGSSFSVLAVHPLIDAAASSPTNAVAIVLDNRGGLRTTVALNIFAIARLAQVKPLNSVSSPEDVVAALAVNEFAPAISNEACFGGDDEEEIVKAAGFKKELMMAANLAQMLAAGGVLMATEAVVEACGRGKEWNLLDRCNVFASDMLSSVGNAREAATSEAVATATMYLYVYLTAVYLHEVLGGRTKDRFEDWVTGLPEIGLLVEKLREHPKAGLKFVEPHNLFLDTDRGPIDRRRGNVLTSNYGLKADHFPGAIRKDMVPRVPGVPNFRKVPHVNVYGVGIPTRRGVLNLLRVLGADDRPIDLCGDAEQDPRIVETHPHVNLLHPGEGPVDPAPRGRVIWMNMREEPLLYVGDRPFVLRDLANPYVNVELTGITPAKIESIEAELREDCLRDAAKYNDQFLIHDEITPGVMGGLWEPGTPDTIITIRDIYDTAVTDGARVTFVRLPVTDEQMPEIRDFDILIQSLLPDIIESVNYPTGDALSLVFNCQMGRGRTTTGMVVACMLIGLVNPDYYTTLRESYPQLYPAEATKWGNGHYSVINELLRVVVDGRDAKKRLDYILEACDKMQNLRTAIELFKNQYESSESSESARARAVHHGKHYLVRYYFLVVINSYLHESWDVATQRLSMTFEEYMGPRDELRHLAARCELK